MQRVAKVKAYIFYFIALYIANTQNGLKQATCSSSYYRTKTAKQSSLILRLILLSPLNFVCLRASYSQPKHLLYPIVHSILQGLEKRKTQRIKHSAGVSQFLPGEQQRSYRVALPPKAPGLFAVLTA